MHGPFASILCPVDFSAHSKRALEYAALVTDRSAGSLSTLFVNDPLLVAAAAAAYDERALASRSRDELQRFVRDAVKTAPARGAAFVAQGQPATEIMRTARSVGARLIVLGSEGLGGAPKLFFGSTTSRVLAHATMPVLAVPPRGRSPHPTWPAPRILAAVSLGRHATRDAATAARLARWFGVPLSLVHVVEPAGVPTWLKAVTGRRTDSGRDGARATLERIAARIAATTPVDVHVAAGDPAEQIAALAADLDARLVIVTLRRAPGILGARQGSISYRVIRETGTPVLAVPSGWRMS